MVIVDVRRYESKKQSDEERYLWGAKPEWAVPVKEASGHKNKKQQSKTKQKPTEQMGAFKHSLKYIPFYHLFSDEVQKGSLACPG